MHAVSRRPHTVGVATGLLTLTLAFYAATHLGINSDNVRLVSEDLSSRRNHEAFAALFPNLENALLIVVEGETPELARDAADALTAKLLQRPDAFADAYVPGGGSFFERVGLLYRSIAELEEFADQMARVQPLLAELERDSSIANLTALVRQGLDAVGPDPAGLRGLVADPPVERLDDIEHRDLVGRAGEAKSTLDAPLRDQQPRSAQGAEQLLEELNRNLAPLGDDRDRDRVAAAARQLGHADNRIPRLRRDRDHWPWFVADDAAAAAMRS